mgnify:FL=1
MKRWYESKTMWVNSLSALVTILGYFNQDLLSSLGFQNTAKFLAVVATITTVVNLFLRLVTNKGIDTSGK